MSAALVQLARDFSPRVETLGANVVTLDIGGLGRLIGEPRAIGDELRRAAADAGLRVHIAIAGTSTTAILLAHARAGLTVVETGAEAATLASLPLRTLTRLDSALLVSGSEPGQQPARSRSAGRKPEAGSLELEVEQLARWGLRTLGDLAALPSSALSARLGQQGLRWQKWARGEEMRPLVPTAPVEHFDASLDLEWPVEGLEPLSFVLARLLDPLCERLERGDHGAVVLRVTLTLVTSASARSASAGPRRSRGEGGRERHERVIELPAPMRDARVLRTLALIDLESHPPSGAVDRVTGGVDVTAGRVLQFGLFARALPGDTLATLTARLGALMGADRVGSPALVDTYRPGAFAMTAFNPPREVTNAPSPRPASTHGASVVRRFRSPIPAKVVLEHGQPARVTTDRRGFGGGRVARCEGPWRSSGDWWAGPHAVRGLHPTQPWNCDEWDVVTTDGCGYRISYARETGTWFMDGLLD